MTRQDTVAVVGVTITLVGAVAIAVRSNEALTGRSRWILAERLEQVRSKGIANENALRHMYASLQDASDRIERLARRLAELERR